MDASQAAVDAAAGIEATATVEDVSGVVRRRIAWLVPTRSRVLVLGDGVDPALLEALQIRGCRTTLVGNAEGTIDGSTAHCDRLLHGTLLDRPVRSQLAEQRFDVVVVGDVLVREKNPADLLSVSAQLLAPEGYFVASVPHAAHGTLRLALLAGELPEPLTASRLYTLERLTALFDSIGCVVAHVERIEAPVAAPPPPEASRVPWTDVVASLSIDPAATTAHFVVMAFPSPAPRIQAFNLRVQRLVERSEVAERALRATSSDVSRLATEVAALRATLETRERDLARLRQQCDSAETAAEQARANASAHERELRIRQLQVATLQSDIERFRSESPDISSLRGAIERLESENQGLNTAKARADAHIAVVRSSFSWRMTRPLRRLVRVIGMNTTESALWWD